MIRAELAIEVTGGEVPAAALPEWLRVSLDSRTLEAGDTFLALRGPNFDGHRFIGDALTKGAAAVIVSDPQRLAPGTPALVVADTAQALAQLARAAADRRNHRAAIFAVTGSAGKTTTTAFIAQLLERLRGEPVVATYGNENNEIGVAKTLLRIDPLATRFVAVEMGARHAGDIEPLVRMADPLRGVITNIGDAHLEIMGSRERLIETKFGIMSNGFPGVLNAQDRDSLAHAARYFALDAFTWFAALEREQPLPAVEGTLVVVRERSHIELYDSRRSGAEAVVAATVTLPGRHNLSNLAAAIATVWDFVDFSRLAEAVGTLHLPAGRYARERVGELEIIYDAYNASMSGTLATLNAFAQERAARRIVVLGSMAELGADSPSMHRQVGGAAAAVADAVLVGGEFADELARGAREAGLAPERLVRFSGNGEAAAWLHGNAREGDLVLLKASRKYQLEEIVESLRAK